MSRFSFCLWLGLIFSAAGLSMPGFAMTLNLQDDGAVFYAFLDGTIQPDTAKNLQDSFDLAVKIKPIAIYIQSEGGAYIGLQPMAKMLLDLATKHYQLHHLPLMIDFQNICVSGCSVLSALLTKYRDPKTMEIRAADDTDFGFHGSVIVGFKHGRVDKAATMEDKEDLEEQIVKTYLDAGVSADFINKNQDIFKNHFKATLFSAKQMCDLKTMVIPPDACVDTQLEVYKWIIRRTSSPQEQRILIPDDCTRDVGP